MTKDRELAMKRRFFAPYARAPSSPSAFTIGLGSSRAARLAIGVTNAISFTLLQSPSATRRAVDSTFLQSGHHFLLLELFPLERHLWFDVDDIHAQELGCCGSFRFRLRRLLSGCLRAPRVPSHSDTAATDTNPTDRRNDEARLMRTSNATCE